MKISYFDISSHFGKRELRVYALGNPVGSVNWLLSVSQVSHVVMSRGEQVKGWGEKVKDGVKRFKMG